MPGGGDVAAVTGTRLSLIGSFTATRDGQAVAGPDLGGRKARLLLKLLAVERGRTVPADRIAEVLWGGEPPAGPAENVATIVSRLRRALGDEVIQGGRPGYRLGPAPAVRVDLDEASRWAGEATRRLAAAEPALAVVAATRAHDLLSAGLVLEDEPAADWAQTARTEQAGLLQEVRGTLAEAALGAGDPTGAIAAAAAAVAGDPFDERARRALMRAHAAAGEPARALASYAGLRDLLATELGADPAPETQELHLAVLREGDLRAPRAGARPGRAGWPVLPGRAAELARRRDLWNAAAEGRPGMTLICGEAGIGKTRLADELARATAGTGGTVLAARCYETERSLFLQPLVDAVAAVVRTIPPARMQDLAGPHGAALARLVPEVAALLGPFPGTGPAELGTVPRPEVAGLERRRAFDALTAFVLALADDRPVLLSLDDLQNAGQATVELLHFLIRHARRGRLLVIATVRAEEGSAAVSSLAGVSERIDLGALSAAAVADLAAEAGLAGQADLITRQTRGHTLFVVETLRALTAGTTGIPDSLEAAVLARVQRTGPAVESALRAAAVPGSSFAPATLAALLGASPHTAVGFCAVAEAARLLVVAERDYEFANDLIQQVLYATTPEPARIAYHGHAADLLTGRPEAMAWHAAAAGDWPRAARGWLLAGEQALARTAAADAEQLLTQSIDAAGQAGDPEVQARSLLARGYAREIQAAYADAVRDIEAAIASARAPSAARCPTRSPPCTAASHSPLPCRTGRPRPGSAVSGLRFTEAAQQGQLAVRAARASGDEAALAVALDGYKAAVAYVGDLDKLRPVLDELEPLLRRRRDLRLLSWTQFESAFPAIAAGDWAAASARVELSLATGRQVGSMAHAAWHIAISGALARLQGHQVEALRRGREAVAAGETEPHAWTIAVAAAELATTLLEAGERQEAITLLERALTAGPEQETEAGRLRCLAPLAEATGSAFVLAEAGTLLAGISAPPGQAWITADGCYLAVARAWLAQGEPERARSTLAPLLAATTQVPWVAPLAAASLVDGLAAAAMGLREEAAGLLKRAADLGHRHGLPRIAADAAAALK